MSNLIEHARRELKLLGEKPGVVEGYLKIVQAFDEMGHFGGSVSISIPKIVKLLNLENLSDLTSDPEEWEERENSLWQSKRNPAAFSYDGGKNYWLQNLWDRDGERQFIASKVKKYVHEIRDFAVRDPEKLKVGMEVLFCHAPINSDNIWSGLPNVEKRTITKLEMLSMDQLTGSMTGKFAGGDKKRLVIFYGDRYMYHHATDAGVVEYDEVGLKGWNDVNFTVIAADLEAAGIVLVNGIPEGHEVRKKAYSWADLWNRDN